LVVRLFQIFPRPIARKQEIEQRFNEVVEKGFHAMASALLMAARAEFLASLTS
jgi:hypothetical protein